jgi:hypothetical protein
MQQTLGQQIVQMADQFGQLPGLHTLAQQVARELADLAAPDVAGSPDRVLRESAC